MSDPPNEREVIDVDDLDLFCTGVRHCVRIDRSPSPRLRKPRDRVVISLDSDSEDPPLAQTLPHLKSHSPSGPRPPPTMDQYTQLQRITQSELASRTALHDGRPTKKRATDAMKMAIDAVKIHNELKRKDRVPEVIEISSDSETEIWPSKRQKLDEHLASPCDTDGKSGDPGDILKLEAEFSRAELHSPGPTDSDDDDDGCIDFLASLDISNEANWVPPPERNKAEDLTPMHGPDSNLSKPQSLPPFHLPRKKPPVDYRHLPLDWVSVGPWGTVSTQLLTRLNLTLSYAVHTRCPGITAPPGFQNHFIMRGDKSVFCLVVHQIFITSKGTPSSS
jgi:hypothetical protein